MPSDQKAEQHLRQVVFRAIETGVPIIRSTTTGISALISPTGEIIRRLESDVEGTMRVRVPAGRAQPTFYVRWGDVFAHACVLALALSALLALRERARASLPLASPTFRSARRPNDGIRVSAAAGEIPGAIRDQD